ncbi:MAG: hypothetical protein ACREMY_25085, partial [bacterium]
MVRHAIQIGSVAGLLLAVAVLLISSRGAAQSTTTTDKKMGRWKLRADSPASGTREYEDRGCGITISVREGVNNRGQEYHSSYAAKVDGKQYPRQVKGSNVVNTIAFTQVDPDTVAFTLRENGTVKFTGTTGVSRDGKLLTVRTKSVNASSRENVEVYD